jgi:hypothetical protein
MLNGIGAAVGATDSVLCTAPSLLVGLGFEADIPGCIAACPLSALSRLKVALVQPTQKALLESKSLAIN